MKEVVELTYKDVENIIGVTKRMSSTTIEDMGKALEFISFTDDLEKEYLKMQKVIEPYALNKNEAAMYYGNMSVTQEFIDANPNIVKSYNSKMQKINEAYASKVSINKIDFSILPIPVTISDLQIIIKVCKGSVRDIINKYNAKLKKDEK